MIPLEDFTDEGAVGDDDGDGDDDGGEDDGDGCKVERRRQELSPSLLSHTCRWGSRMKVRLGANLLVAQFIFLSSYLGKTLSELDFSCMTSFFIF